jgi:hypothetical protein
MAHRPATRDKGGAAPSTRAATSGAVTGAGRGIKTGGFEIGLIKIGMKPSQVQYCLKNNC